MKRFSVADGLYERLAQQTVNVGGESYGPQWTPEQRPRMRPWPQDERFKFDPKTNQVFFDEMLLTPEEVQTMQREWAEEGDVEKEISEIGKKMGVEGNASDVNHIVYPIAQQYFSTLQPNQQVSKEELHAYVNKALSGMGASTALLTHVSGYINDLFLVLHNLERMDHMRHKSIRAIRQRKISAVILASYYKMFVRRAQVEEEWIPSASEQRTIKRLDRIWAIDELQRMKSGQTPQQYYGLEQGAEYPVLTKEEAEKILLDTREHEDFAVPFEDMPTNVEQKGLGGEDIEPLNEELEIEKELAKPRNNAPVPEAEIEEVIQAPVENEPEVSEEEEEDPLYVTKREQDEIEGED